MCTFFESEAATQVWLLQRPSGENARYLGYILLSVAAIHAESVQFHQFAAVVFVKSVALAFGLVRLPVIPDAPLPVIIGSVGNAVGDVGVRSDAQPVIKIKQHGWTLCGRDQQVFKLAESMRANDIAFVACKQVVLGALADEYVEVVEPEIGHHFLQLAIAVYGTQ